MGWRVREWFCSSLDDLGWIVVIVIVVDTGSISTCICTMNVGQSVDVLMILWWSIRTLSRVQHEALFVPNMRMVGLHVRLHIMSTFLLGRPPYVHGRSLFLLVGGGRCRPWQ